MNISIVAVVLFFGPIFSQVAPPADAITRVWSEECFVVQIENENYLVSESYVKCYNLTPTGKKTIYFAIEQKGKVPFLRSITEETFRRYRDGQ